MKAIACLLFYLILAVQCPGAIDSLAIKQKADSITNHLQTQQVSLDSAFILVDECTALYRSIGEWRSYAYSLFGKSIIYGYKNDYVNEINYMDSVIMYDKYLCEEKDIIYFGYINGLFQHYNSLGLRVKANQILKRAMKDLDQVTNAELSSLLKANLASEYKKNGDYITSLDLYSQIYSQADRVHDKAEALMNMALLQNKLGDFFESEKSINAAVQMIKNFEALSYTKTIKKRIIIAKGTLLLSDNNFSQLNGFFNKHEPTFKGKKTTQSIYFYHLKAQSELAQAKFEEARNSIDYVSDVINSKIKKNNNYKFRELEKVLLSKFKIYSALGDNEYALETLENLLGVLQFDYNSFRINANSHLNLEVATKALCEWIEILKLDKSAAQNEKIFLLYLEILRLQKVSYSILVNSSYEEYWAQSNMKIISDAIQYFHKSKQLDYVFELMEMNKSNLLVESITDSQAKGIARVPQRFLEREITYLSNINFFNSKIKKLERDSSNSANIASMQEAISVNQLRLENLLDSLEILYPEYHAIKYEQGNLTPVKVQEMLHRNEALVEYFIGENLAIVAVLTKKDFKIISLESIDSLLITLPQYAAQIRNPKVGMGTISEFSNSLFNKLLLPVLNVLPTEINTLVIVQDGALSNLPFSILKDVQGKYVLNSYSASYQYSARLWELLLNKKKGKYTYDWTGFSYNAKGKDFVSKRDCASLSNSSLLCSQREIKQISDLLGNQTISYKDRSLEGFLEKAKHSKIIHLATHSCLDLEDYNLSRLYFNESYLTYNDIQLNEFDVELAVVSSCESGYGKVIKGEGAMSIAKAFFQAGSKSALVSLWPVDDCSTADIMKYFYQNLEKGMAKSQSLKVAKLSYLETAHPSRTHPYYWAGFVLIGNDEAVFAGHSGMIVFFYLGIGLLLFGLIFFIKTCGITKKDSKPLIA